MKNQICAFCDHAKMRIDICGIYCTGGFANVDGSCEHFKPYVPMKGLDDKLIRAINGLAVETGSLACLGCGWEHNCGVHGCAILRSAADVIETQRRELATAKEAICQMCRKCSEEQHFLCACVSCKYGGKQHGP